MSATLRVLSYNIHKGFSFSRRKFVLERLRESIRLVNADIVFLQEVLGHHESRRSRIRDWPTQAQFEFLAHEVWSHRAYGKNAVYASGHHGNAILSKHPIESYENLDISTNKFERRGLLHAVLKAPGKAGHIHAVCLHLGLFESERRHQVSRLVHRIESRVPADAPLIVAGDFNDWWQQAAIPLTHELSMKEAYLEIHGTHALTFPSWFPALPLDRIYVRHFETISAEALSGPPWANLSDHLALFAELKTSRASS